MNKMHFIFFFSIALLVYAGMHYYIYHRISTGFLMGRQTGAYLGIIFILGALSFFASEILGRQTANVWVKPLSYFGTIWLGTISIAFTILVLRDILLIFLHTESFRYHSAVISTALIVLLSLFSIYNVQRGWVLREINIKIGKLPENLPKFVLVQLSDIHLSFMKSQKWFDGIIEETDRLGPDLIVITGDLVDADVSRINGLFDGLKKLKSKYGVFAVTGNHEFYAGIDKFLQVAQESDIHVLRNENVTIAGAIELVGIDDPQGIRFSQGGANFAKALSEPKQVDTRKPTILLSHRPEFFDDAEKMGIDLQLSGHYHAGQIPPLDLIVMLYYKYPYGLYKKGKSYLYIASGTGTWGPPMRLFSKSEIVKIVIER